MRYFFDTEFIERGRSEPIRFISIGIVAEDGRELYRETRNAPVLLARDFEKYDDPWLLENVAPHLKGGDAACWPGDIAREILQFCDVVAYGKPEFWAYYADYDWVVLCQLFGRMIDLPKGWPMYCRDLKQFCDEHGGIQLPKQDETEEHNALNDAKWVRLAWNFAKMVALETETR